MFTFLNGFICCDNDRSSSCLFVFRSFKSFWRCFDRHQGFVKFVETAAVLSTCFYANKISKATAGGKSCWSVPMSEDVLLVQLVDHW